MMLASTVQFSKYGRSRPATATRLWQTGPVRLTRQAAVPSGPNSVLGLCNPQDQASRAAVSCDTAAVLTCPG